MKDLKSARQRFKSMHSESFVIPIAWSVGEIRQLEKLGFGAIATTSAGLSASMGSKDLTLSRDETLQNIRIVCAAKDLPANADFEAGFAEAAAGVGANVAMAAEAGVSGLSIEDRKGGALYALPEAVARIKAAAAIEQGPPGPHLEIRPAWKQSWWTRSSAMHRFEMPVGDDIAVSYYKKQDGRVVLLHTEVPQRFTGQDARSIEITDDNHDDDLERDQNVRREARRICRHHRQYAGVL